MRGWLRAGGEPRVGPRAECGPDRVLLPSCLRRTLHAPNAFEKRGVRADSNLRGRQISIDAFASGGFGTGFVSPPRVGAAAAAAASPITRSVCGPLIYAASTTRRTLTS